MKVDRQGKAGFFNLHLDVEMEFPRKYWQSFIDELKQSIPWRERDYDPKAETWIIADAHYQVIIDLRKKHFEKDQMNLFEIPKTETILGERK